MKKNKGFTLIELLAIIVILAIIAVITVPIILNVIENSKKGAAIDSAYGYKESVEKYYVSRIIESNSTQESILNGTYTILDGKLNGKSIENLEIPFTGIKPSNGLLIYENNKLIDACITINTYSLKYIKNKFVLSENEMCETNENIKEEENIEPFTKTFAYINGEETYQIPVSGYYKLEAWGAQGGTYSVHYGVDRISRGGYGGYSTGTIYLKKGTNIYVNVGGRGSTNTGNSGDVVNGGYNGGAACTKDKWGVCNSSGGATHIALMQGQLYELSAYKGEYDETAGVHRSTDILIVAGGGGAGGIENVSYDGVRLSTGGSGGGYKGAPGGKTSDVSDSSGLGGTQTTMSGTQFGKGNNGTGWYGVSGAGFYGGQNGAGCGGGSGYIGNSALTNKIMYCYGCEESEETETKTVSTTNTNNPLRDGTNCSSGYSNSPVSKCAKGEDGYAQLSYLGKSL